MNLARLAKPARPVKTILGNATRWTPYGKRLIFSAIRMQEHSLKEIADFYGVGYPSVRRYALERKLRTPKEITAIEHRRRIEKISVPPRVDSQIAWGWKYSHRTAEQIAERVSKTFRRKVSPGYVQRMARLFYLERPKTFGEIKRGLINPELRQLAAREKKTPRELIRLFWDPLKAMDARFPIILWDRSGDAPWRMEDVGKKVKARGNQGRKKRAGPGVSKEVVRKLEHRAVRALSGLVEASHLKPENH